MCIILTQGKMSIPNNCFLLSKMLSNIVSNKVRIVYLAYNLFVCSNGWKVFCKAFVNLTQQRRNRQHLYGMAWIKIMKFLEGRHFRVDNNVREVIFVTNSANATPHVIINMGWRDLGLRVYIQDRDEILWVRKLNMTVGAMGDVPVGRSWGTQSRDTRKPWNGWSSRPMRASLNSVLLVSAVVIFQFCSTQSHFHFTRNPNRRLYTMQYKNETHRGGSIVKGAAVLHRDKNY